MIPWIRHGKFRGYIVDYYGLSDYLQDALEVFSKDDVAGALIPIKDELPRLERRHTRVMGYFAGVDRTDMEACVNVLEDEEVRSEFHIALRKFLESMDIILPNALAAPYVPDMKFLGLVLIRARNRFRPANPDLFGCGEKVRRLIDTHVYSTGIDPRIPPMEVFDPGFAAYVEAMKSPRARASEIEHAIGIKDYRRQWGSCYQDGSTFLNWKTIIAPLRIVDYVIIHELCHRQHHDHSKAFWKLLAVYLPDCANAKEWLRVHGGLLAI